MRTIGPWTLDPVPIGNGSFAIVWKAVNRETGKLAAVKEISTERLSPKLQSSLASEIEVLQRACHKNIVGLLGLVEVCVCLLLSRCRTAWSQPQV
jgi:serine/threonine protein kinase